MNTYRISFGVALLLFSVLIIPVACTNRQPTASLPVTIDTTHSATSSLTHVSYIQFAGQNNGSTTSDTYAMQIKRSGNVLYLTGTPFGFMAMDITNNPPVLLYDVKDNITQFSPGPPPAGNLGFWDPSQMASGALGILGSYAIMSGRFATSVVSISSSIPVEKLRYPMPDGSGNQGADAAFIYSAIVPHPTLPLFYAFKQTDYMYEVDFSAAPNLKLVARAPYVNGGTTCCVVGAEAFQGQIALAMTNRIWFFSMGADGTIGNWVESTALQATAVAASDDHLYFYNAPQANTANPSPRGIYAINTSGQADAFYPMSQVYNFAVSHDNTYMYINQNNKQIDVYLINQVSTAAAH